MRVRIAAVQYHLRHLQDWAGFESQVDFVLDAAAEYRPHFVLLPEIFTTQLMSLLDVSDVRRAVRELSGYTPRYVDLMRRHAQKHGYHLVAGSHPTLRGDRLYNTAYLFNPAGEVFEQDKLHRTRWEKEHWDTTPGEALSLFETAHGRIAIRSATTWSSPSSRGRSRRRAPTSSSCRAAPTTGRGSCGCATAATRAPSRTRCTWQ